MSFFIPLSAVAIWWKPTIVVHAVGVGGIRALGEPCQRLIVYPGSVRTAEVWVGSSRGGVGSGCQRVKGEHRGGLENSG